MVSGHNDLKIKQTQGDLKMRKNLMTVLITVGVAGMGGMLMAQEVPQEEMQIIVQDNFRPSNDEGMMELFVNDDELLAFDEKNDNVPGDRMDRQPGPQPQINNSVGPQENCPVMAGDKQGCPKAEGPQACPGKCPKMEGQRGMGKYPQIDKDKQGHRGMGQLGDKCQRMGDRRDGKGPQMGDRRNGQEGIHNGHPGQDGRTGFGHPMMMKYLAEKFPTEMEEIKQLRRQSDEVRKLADSKLRELVKKTSEEMKARREKMEQFHKDVQEYRKNKDEKLLAKIEAQIGEFYTERLDSMKKKLATEETYLKEKTAEYERLAAEKEQEIAKRVKELTTPDAK